MRVDERNINVHLQIENIFTEQSIIRGLSCKAIHFHRSGFLLHSVMLMPPIFFGDLTNMVYNCIRQNIGNLINKSF